MIPLGHRDLSRPSPEAAAAQGQVGLRATIADKSGTKKVALASAIPSLMSTSAMAIRGDQPGRGHHSPAGIDDLAEPDEAGAAQLTREVRRDEPTRVLGGPGPIVETVQLGPQVGFGILLAEHHRPGGRHDEDVRTPEHSSRVDSGHILS